jgi:hypothetical protein
MTALPVWLLVLLGIGPVLWFAFCVLKAQFGLTCGWACGTTVLLIDVVALAWLALQGHAVMNGPQIAFLIVCLVSVNAGLGIGWLTAHLSRKRKAEAAAQPPGAGISR